MSAHKYTHNGEEVIYQQIDVDFLWLLNKNGIIPQELPDPDLNYRVFKYEKDGRVRYACVLNTVGEEPSQKVFITYSVPEDGFYKLMLDVQGQIDHGDPARIESRLHIAVAKAEREVSKGIDEKYPDKQFEFMLNGYPADVQKEYDFQFKISMADYGYYSKTLDQIEAPDVDKDSLRKLLL